MLPEELFQKRPAVAKEADDVPGQRDDGERAYYRRTKPIEHPAAAHPRERQCKYQRYEAFRQDGQTEQGRGPRQEAALAALDPPEREQHGGGEGGRHRKIGDADVAEAEPSGRGRENRGGKSGRRVAKLAAQYPIKEDKECHADQGYGQAWREIFVQSGAKCSALNPVEQRRFFKPVLAPQSRRHPIAGPRHFPADSGVARLIGPQQPCARQAEEIQKVGKGQGEQQRPYRRAKHSFLSWHRHECLSYFYNWFKCALFSFFWRRWRLPMCATAPAIPANPRPWMRTSAACAARRRANPQTHRSFS